MKSGQGKTSENIKCEKPIPENNVKHDVDILYNMPEALYVPKLKLECVNRRPDIICIVETWLDDTVSRA